MRKASSFTVNGMKVSIGQMPLRQSLTLRFEIVALLAQLGSAVTVGFRRWLDLPGGDLCTGVLSAIRHLTPERTEQLLQGLLTNVQVDGKPLDEGLELLSDLADLDAILVKSIEVNFGKSFTAIVALAKAAIPTTAPGSSGTLATSTQDSAPA